MPLKGSDYKLPEDLERYHAAVKEYVRTDLEAIAEEMEETKEAPPDIVSRMREAGVLTLTLPKKYGGSGLTYSQYWPIQADLAKPSGAIRMYPHVYNGFWRIVDKYSTNEEQRARLLSYWHQGERCIACILTEREAGTGVDVRTTAKKVGDKYVINGEKHLCTFADFADYFFVVAYTGDRSLGARGISMLTVPHDAPGFVIEPMEEMMGLKGSYHGNLYFRNCEIPQDHILGEEGQGLEMFLWFLDISRLNIAVNCLGSAERLLELAADFAKKRVTFGRAIAERQAVQQMLGEMYTDIYMARSGIAECSRKYDAGEPIAAEASACKLFALEAAGRVSDRALIIHGGIGYTKAYPVERVYRDLRAMWFEEGTPTIQRLVTGRHVLGRRVRSTAT